MRTARVSVCLRAVALALMALAVLPVPVEAVALAAKVTLTQAKIPGKLNERGLLQFVESHRTTRLTESKEQKLEERRFTAEMVTRFNGVPGDLEFHVLFYDVHDGSRQFVEDMSTFIDDRTQKVFLSRISLPRPRFKPNRRMELVITVRRAEVGSLKFTTDGEEVRRSGVVNFGDSET